jgi:hypothetical protein
MRLLNGAFSPGKQKTGKDINVMASTSANTFHGRLQSLPKTGGPIHDPVVPKFPKLIPSRTGKVKRLAFVRTPLTA